MPERGYSPPAGSATVFRALLRRRLDPLAFLVLSAAFAGAFIWAFVRGRPRTRGVVDGLDGLDGQVRIERDGKGVPHLRANGEADLFFAQGFVHAQDRWTQMDLQRRFAQGRLSELFGARALGSDRFFRGIGLAAAAERDLSALDAASLAALEAYTAGVNAYLERGRRPVEYLVLRRRPEPWLPLDTMALAKLMQWQFNDDWYKAVVRDGVVRAVGPVRAAELLGGPVERSAPAPKGRPARRRTAPAAGAADGLGSNAWAVAGSHTATGKPLLANDTHLDLGLPGTWYQMGLRSPGYACTGVSVPGMFGIVIGHNGRISWGLAMQKARVQDLYIEELHPDDPERYLTPDGDERLGRREERIAVRGRAEPEIVRVRTTRHGPVLRDAGVPLGVTENGIAETESDVDGHLLVLRWMTAERPSGLVGCILPLGRARDWSEFTEALRGWDAPMGMFVYADRDGNIGRRCAGAAPIRARGASLTPVEGRREDAAWTGAVPFDLLPSEYNPASGIVVAANSAPESLPDDLIAEWCTDSRTRRITELLAPRTDLTTGDMAAIQTDDLSIPARTLAPHFAAAPAASASARARLAAWDHRMSADSVAAAIYQTAVRRLVRALVEPSLGTDLADDYLTREHRYTAFLLDILEDPASPWWGPGGRDAALAEALDGAVSDLRDRFGADESQWTWGRLHRIAFGHAFWGRVPLVRRLAGAGPRPVAGDSQTVMAMGFHDTLDAVSGPAHRHVVSLADWDDCHAVVAGGQSGHIGHRNYRDQLPLWRSGGLHPLPWSPEAVARASKRTLLLRGPRRAGEEGR